MYNLFIRLFNLIIFSLFKFYFQQKEMEMEISMTSLYFLGFSLFISYLFAVYFLN